MPELFAFGHTHIFKLGNLVYQLGQRLHSRENSQQSTVRSSRAISPKVKMVFTFSWTGRDSILDGPTFQISRPPRSFFSFPPSPYPNALPAPIDEGSLRSPFAIDATLYNKLLDGKVPLIFASIYILSVLSCNQINRRRGNKPWAISKTGLFYLFVILHNVALAVYSGITCYAMFFGLRNTLPPIFDAGVTGTVDALCKMHGPRGLGDAITYNTTTRAWAGHNRFIHLSDDGLTPDSTDVGRLWNEGLAFWGWFFYLSKFYEVVDTMIILLKGKRSATLQTYHHAGAMMCMWAGMRYMSPPIWMFVLVNSGIHTLMVSTRSGEKGHTATDTLPVVHLLHAARARHKGA